MCGVIYTPFFVPVTSQVEDDDEEVRPSTPPFKEVAFEPLIDVWRLSELTKSTILAVPVTSQEGRVGATAEEG